MAVVIELTEQEAAAFRLLSQARAWDLRKGSVTLHFDQQGNPTSAETRTFTVIGVINSGKDGDSLTVHI